MASKIIVILTLIFLFDYSTCFLTSQVYKIYNKTRMDNEIIGNYRQVPLYLDWREESAVSPIKNQNSSAVSWAFGIAAHLESQYKLQYGVETTISEQFLIDCLNTTTGDEPGNVLNSLAEISSSYGGVLGEQDYYPYSSTKKSCRWSGDRNILHLVSGFKRLLFANEVNIIEALVKQGPVIAGINSNSMVVYKGGIDEPTDVKCDPKKLNHVVLIVGYNVYVNPETNHFVPYWIIKNSWGDTWGDNGFYYLVRGRNACGIESEIAHAFVY